VSPHRGLVNGFLAPFRGAVYMARRRLWRFLLVPLVLNLALAVGALWAASVYWRQELSQHLDHSPVLGETPMLGRGACRKPHITALSSPPGEVS